jgi:tetratricopeptide (TPR) repeat protein
MKNRLARIENMKSFKSWLWISAAAGALAVSAADAADIVNRKSGEKRVAGAITGATKTEVTVKPSTGEPVSIPANDVASVDWDEAPSDMKLGKGDETNGRYEAALQKFTKAADEVKSGSDLVKTDLDFLIARTTARLALTDPARRDEAVTKLSGFLKAHSDSFRFYDAQQWLGQVHLARQDFSAARSTFETLGQAPWSDYQLSAKASLGRVLMGENKLEEAIQAFDAAVAAAGPSPADQDRKYEAMVGKARALIALNKKEEALTVLDEVVDKGPQDVSALMAEAYVLQGDCLQAVNKTKEAVLAYLHVDVLFQRESASHAEALYHLAKLWKTVQHPDRALEAQAKLEGTYPNSEWTKKLGSGATE